MNYPFKIFQTCLCIVLLCSCNEANNHPIEEALSSNNDKIKAVTDHLADHEVQIIYTNIIENDSIKFEDYSYQLDDSVYYYPASSVKFPIAILALEKLNHMPQIDMNTRCSVDGDSITSRIAKYIQKIFAVSDNEAYNRLFEFLGRDYINQKLSDKGILAKINHRLSVENSADSIMKKIEFYSNDSLLLTIPERTAKEVERLQLKNTSKGIGYTVGDSLIKEPMDFSKKNYLPLTSLHGIMKRLMFPNKFKPSERFDLEEKDRDYIINQMKMTPKESGYDESEYYDSYVKFLLVGDRKESWPPEYSIYNKVGYAYGYLTDCAFIENSITGESAIISATIKVNNNRIYNDGIYEYETIGIPFLAELGRQLMNFK